MVEPKALLSSDLQDLILRYRSPKKAAAVIGVSEAFVRQNAKSNIALYNYSDGTTEIFP